MDTHDIDEGRRGFLAQMVAAGALGVAGSAVGVGPAAAAVGLAPKGPYGIDVLEAPIVLRAGEKLERRTFLISPNFENAGHSAIIWVQGDNVTIRDVRLIGPSQWLSHWNNRDPAVRQQPGLSRGTTGIRAQNVSGLHIERVHIEGLPKSGISGFGWNNALVREVSIRHCFAGISLSWYEPNVNVTIERVRVGDTWMGSPPGDPSRARPGGYIGGNGLVLNSLRDSTVSDCAMSGEMYGAIKLTNPHRVTVRGCRGCGLQVQGINQGESGAHMRPASDTLIVDCVFDKGLGYSPTVLNANCMQLTHHVGSTTIRRCFLDAAGTGGHGIQVVNNSNAQIEGCVIRGFNQKRGNNPAYALHVIDRSTANKDVTLVNTFINQQRILLQ